MKQQIEDYLFYHGDWVATENLVYVFNIDPRQLRSNGSQPGLCSDFAISGPRGFRHILKCTDQEWNFFEARIRTHGLSELHRVSVLKQKRDSGQLTLAL